MIDITIYENEFWGRAYLRELIVQILSLRNWLGFTCWQQVYEWEDVLSRECGFPIVDDARAGYLIGGCKRLLPWFARMVKTGKPSFVFKMTAAWYEGEDKPNIIPCIIDFFLKDERSLARFCKSARRNPVTLISSREAYDFLKERQLGIRIQHFPLSISDKYRLDANRRLDKVYDLAVAGRVNPVLAAYLKQYEQRHPDFRYVKYQSNGKGGYFGLSDGTKLEGLEDGLTRECYMKLLSQSRAVLYGTPGMDNARLDANGFNQVTPRFLEAVASGCHVLARYPDNSDTRFYELPKIAPHLDSYKAFEERLDYARGCLPDIGVYADYLNKHYTSNRARLLVDVLRESDFL